MTEQDPKRWSEQEDEAMRSFVSALKVEPSRENRDAVWAGISAALGGGSEGGSSEGGAPPKPSNAPPPAGAAGLGVGAKVVGGAIALLGAGALLFYATRSPVSSTPIATPAVTSAAPIAALPSETSIASETAAPSSVPVASAVPSAVVAKAVRPNVPSAAEPTAKPSAAPTASVSRADALREETDGVRRARASLRAGDPRAALAELEGLDRKFPAGLLEEEREVLRIEALFAAKDPSAPRRADRFLLERPQSVHVARIKALLGR